MSAPLDAWWLSSLPDEVAAYASIALRNRGACTASTVLADELYHQLMARDATERRWIEAGQEVARLRSDLSDIAADLYLVGGNYPAIRQIADRARRQAEQGPRET